MAVVHADKDRREREHEFRADRRRDRDAAINARMRVHRHNVCLNCGEPGEHFVPPCFRERGYFTCESLTLPLHSTPEKDGERYERIEQV